MVRCLLGVRKDKAGKFVMGRESFLRRSTWNGGWPSLKLVTLDTSGRKKPGDDTFTAARDFGRQQDRHSHSFVHGPGPIRKRLPRLSKSQRHLDGESRVTIHPSPSWANAGVQAGVACYKDEHRFISLYVDVSTSTSAVVFELYNKAKGISRSERPTWRSGT
ncbi:hypothetical protein VUR80DRAFT_6823 [Thermomyces stellatus]